MAYTVNGGALLVNSTLSSPGVTVNNSGSLLGGTGTINAPITVNTGAAITAGTSYNQVVGSGTFTLKSSTLEGSIASGLPFNNGQALELIANTGTGALVGTFNGVAQGSTVTLEGYNFTVSYTGVDGNGFTLTAITAVPEPAISTWMGDALMLRSLGTVLLRRFWAARQAV